MQAFLFNDKYESKDINIYEYLMLSKHKIITIRMLQRASEFWDTRGILWHLERGLIVNKDGTGPP